MSARMSAADSSPTPMKIHETMVSQAGMPMYVSFRRGGRRRAGAWRASQPHRRAPQPIVSVRLAGRAAGHAGPHVPADGGPHRDGDPGAGAGRPGGTNNPQRSTGTASAVSH